MKRYKYFYLVPAMALLCCNTSCELDQLPEGGIITTEQKDQIQLSDPAKLNADVVGLASALIKLEAISEWAGGTLHFDYGFASACMMLDASGMDMPSEDTGYNWYRDGLRLTDRTDTGENTYFFWNLFYNEIKMANDILKVAKADAEDPTMKKYRGQALGFRAWAYLNLIQIYQFTYKGHEDAPGVPIQTEFMTQEEAANNPRATVAKVYETIMTDLDEAISLLTTERQDKSQININVAYGLRARANLLMQNWEDAAKDATEAMKGFVPYTREQVSKPSFNSADVQSWMWANIIGETSDVVQSGILNFPSHMCSFTGNGYAPGYAGRYINSKLYNEIPENDVRKLWWVLGEAVYNPENPKEFWGYDFTETAPQVDWNWKINYRGNDYNIAEWLGWQAPYLNIKFGPYQNIYNNATNACDFPLMRVEEMILIKAEALAQQGLGGDAAIALKDLMKNRDESWNKSSVTVDDVWFQRRIELWGEGFSFFDMMRLKKPLDRTGANFAAGCAFNIPAESQILLWIIPEDEINNNKGITPEDNNEIVAIPKG